MSSVHSDKVYGHGINDADYVTKDCPFYRVWIHMLERACCEKLHKKNPSYKNVTICDEWLIFSNFKKWMESQDWKGKSLDKDLLKYGNKHYSPEFCMFIPKNINSLLTHKKSSNGSSPVGVSAIKNSDKFKATLSMNGEKIYLGTFVTIREAALAYIDRKIKYFKFLAAMIKDKKLSMALNNYADEYRRECLNAD